MLIAVLSVCLHYGFLGGLRLVKLQHKRVQSLEEIPERFARLIAEKPIPKKKKHRTLAPASAGRGVNGRPGGAEKRRAGAAGGREHTAG